MVVALAGRRIDAEQSQVIRFPLSNVPLVEARLEVLFAQLQPPHLVSAAACGADLLGLRVAGRMGCQRSIVLPSDPSTFRVSSVTDRPGNWGEEFDATLREVQAKDGLVVLNVPNDQSGYLAVNAAILDLAASQAGAEQATAVIVWNGESRGQEDVTDAFRQDALQRGFLLQEVSTL